MELRFEDVDFGYKNQAQVLHKINLTINEPGLTCIIGPNGVGKSTLVKCMNKLLIPNSGKVTLDDREVKDFNLKELSTITSFVPATSMDNFSLNVIDTVLMGRHPYSKIGSEKEDMHIVYGILKSLNITHLAMRNYNELSAGQHQKVSIARGLAQEPRILILDEPTANLDIRHQVKVIELLHDMAHEKGMTVIMISHDINIASKYSDNIIMMHDGGIYALGRPKDVITAENISKVYQVGAKIIDDNGKPHVILVGNDDTNYDDDHQFSVIATKSGETYKGP